jgi:hypothetical protein
MTNGATANSMQAGKALEALSTLLLLRYWTECITKSCPCNARLRCVQWLSVHRSAQHAQVLRAQ